MKREISEFFNEVRNDEKLIKSLREGKESDKNASTRDVVKEILLPYSRKLGYDFSEAELLEAFTHKLSSEELEQVSGGINAGWAVLPMLAFLGVSGGAIASATDGPEMTQSSQETSSEDESDQEDTDSDDETAQNDNNENAQEGQEIEFDDNEEAEKVSEIEKFSELVDKDENSKQTTRNELNRIRQIDKKQERINQLEKLKTELLHKYYQNGTIIFSITPDKTIAAPFHYLKNTASIPYTEYFPQLSVNPKDGTYAIPVEREYQNEYGNKKFLINGDIAQMLERIATGKELPQKIEEFVDRSSEETTDMKLKDSDALSLYFNEIIKKEQNKFNDDSKNNKEWPKDLDARNIEFLVPDYFTDEQIAILQSVLFKKLNTLNPNIKDVALHRQGKLLQLDFAYSDRGVKNGKVAIVDIGKKTSSLTIFTQKKINNGFNGNTLTERQDIQLDFGTDEVRKEIKELIIEKIKNSEEFEENNINLDRKDNAINIEKFVDDCIGCMYSDESGEFGTAIELAYGKGDEVVKIGIEFKYSDIASKLEKFPKEFKEKLENNLKDELTKLTAYTKIHLGISQTSNLSKIFIFDKVIEDIVQSNRDKLDKITSMQIDSYITAGYQAFDASKKEEWLAIVDELDLPALNIKRLNKDEAVNTDAIKKVLDSHVKAAEISSTFNKFSKFSNKHEKNKDYGKVVSNIRKRIEKLKKEATKNITGIINDVREKCEAITENQKLKDSAKKSELEKILNELNGGTFNGKAIEEFKRIEIDVHEFEDKNNSDKDTTTKPTDVVFSVDAGGNLKIDVIKETNKNKNVMKELFKDTCYQDNYKGFLNFYKTDKETVEKIAKKLKQLSKVLNSESITCDFDVETATSKDLKNLNKDLRKLINMHKFVIANVTDGFYASSNSLGAKLKNGTITRKELMELNQKVEAAKSRYNNRVENKLSKLNKKKVDLTEVENELATRRSNKKDTIKYLQNLNIELDELINMYNFANDNLHKLKTLPDELKTLPDELKTDYDNFDENPIPENLKILCQKIIEAKNAINNSVNEKINSLKEVMDLTEVENELATRRSNKKDNLPYLRDLSIKLDALINMYNFAYDNLHELKTLPDELKTLPDELKTDYDNFDENPTPENLKTLCQKIIKAKNAINNSVNEKINSLKKVMDLTKVENELATRRSNKKDTIKYLQNLNIELDELINMYRFMYDSISTLPDELKTDCYNFPENPTPENLKNLYKKIIKETINNKINSLKKVMDLTKVENELATRRSNKKDNLPYLRDLRIKLDALINMYNFAYDNLHKLKTLPDELKTDVDNFYKNPTPENLKTLCKKIIEAKNAINNSVNEKINDLKKVMDLTEIENELATRRSNKKDTIKYLQNLNIELDELINMYSI